MTYTEVAELLSSVLGRRITYRAPGLIEYARRARAWGMTPAMIAVTAALYSTARLGIAAGLTDDVRSVTGRRPAGVRSVFE